MAHVRGHVGSSRENPVTYGMPSRERKSRIKSHDAMYKKSLAKGDKLFNKPLNPALPRWAGKIQKGYQVSQQAKKSGKIAKTLIQLRFDK